ncbi:MAG: tetratricopeptide repeat protein [Planctomycetota bacterium]|jgi:tetratricopeptide (TPR) repeat protein
MDCKAKILMRILLVCTFLLNGCDLSDRGEESKGPQIDAGPKLSPEQQEVELLAEINRKFENPDAHFRLGRLYQATKRWEEAEYHYNIALSFDPVHWPAHAAMVKMLEERGEPGKAKLAADIYMNQTATSVERSLQLGQAFQEQQVGEYALACYEQALRLEPNSARVYKHIGYYYLARKNKMRAEEYFRRSFELDPLQPDVAYELGQLGVPIKVRPKTEESEEKSGKITEQPDKKIGP